MPHVSPAPSLASDGSFSSDGSYSESSFSSHGSSSSASSVSDDDEDMECDRAAAPVADHHARYDSPVQGYADQYYPRGETPERAMTPSGGTIYGDSDSDEEMAMSDEEEYVREDPAKARAERLPPAKKRVRNDDAMRNVPAGASTGFVSVKDLLQKGKKRKKAPEPVDFDHAAESDDDDMLASEDDDMPEGDDDMPKLAILTLNDSSE